MFKPNWLRLPGGIALAMGIGAPAPVSAQPDPRTVVRNPTGGGELLLRVEREQLQISENGGPFEELVLRDAAEVRHLKNLIERRNTAEGSSVVDVGPTILASGGGAGFFWNLFAKKDIRPLGKAGAPAKETIPKKPGRHTRWTRPRPTKRVILERPSPSSRAAP